MTELELSALVQSRVSKAAESLLRAGATRSGISLSAYVRQVLYRHLGLIPAADKEKT